MPKLLHERLRGLIPEKLRSRIPEKVQPPAWRKPVEYAQHEWAKGETGALEWVPGDDGQTLRDTPAIGDSKGKALPVPITIPAGTKGKITAVGPGFVVFQVGAEPGVRVNKTDVVDAKGPKERKWAAEISATAMLEVTAEDLPAKERVTWEGLPISLEVLGGEERVIPPYSQFIPEEWLGMGYFEKLPAEDGDSLDVIIGPTTVGDVFLATQLDNDSGAFLQFKVMLGFTDEAEAEAGFKLLWPSAMFGGLTRIPPESFMDSVVDKLVVEASANDVLKWHKLDIVLEARGGETRPTGDEQQLPEEWRGLGYFEGLRDKSDADGQELDVVVGPGDLDGDAFLVIQLEDGAFRQWKVALGFRTPAEAEAAFKLIWAPETFGGVWSMPAKKFRKLVLPRLTKEASKGRPFASSAQLDSSFDERLPDGTGGDLQSRSNLARGHGLVPFYDRRAADPDLRSINTFRFDIEVGEDSMDACDADADVIRDGLQRPAFLTQAQGTLHAPGQARRVQSNMLGLGHEPQIGGVVVQSVAINVVDHLGSLELTSKDALHHEPVLSSVTIGPDLNHSVAGAVPAVSPDVRHTSRMKESHWQRQALLQMEVDPLRITEPHPVKNVRKYHDLVASMMGEGWNGRPILVYVTGGNYQALTGSHRIAAARAAGLDRVPILLVENQDFSTNALFTLLDDAADNYDRLRALERAVKANEQLQPAYELMLQEVAEKNNARITRTSALIEVDADDFGMLHVGAGVADGLSLKRTGHQRYEGTTADGRRVWIGCVERVAHGTFPAGRRQRREKEWVAKIDGIEVGSAGSLRSARALLASVAKKGFVIVGDESKTGYLRDGKVPGDKAVVVVRVPSALARMWPKEIVAENGPPHFTIAYIPGPHSDADKARLEDIVREIAEETAPIPVELERNVEWFTTDNQEKENREIAHKDVHPKTAERMATMHWRLLEALEAAGFKPSRRDEFNAHSTLEYCPTREYSGPVPEGGFTARAVELWGWDEDIEVPLSGESVGWSVMAHGQRRRKTLRERKQRFVRPTWYLKPGSHVAFTAAYGTDGEEIWLAPSARVLDLSETQLQKSAAHDPDVAALVAAVQEQVEAIKALSVSITQLLAANSLGFDAIRTEDRLIVLNPEAVQRAPKRQRWAELSA